MHRVEAETVAFVSVKRVKLICRSYAVTHILCVLRLSVMSLCDPMDCSLPGSSVHGIFQAGYIY